MGLSKEEQRNKIRDAKPPKEIKQVHVKKKWPKLKITPSKRFQIDSILVRGVYFLYQDNICVYIGSSVTNIMYRICKHFKEKGKKKNFNNFSYFKMDEDDETIRRFEKSLIKKHKPEYNMTHNSNNKLCSSKKTKRYKRKGRVFRRKK